MKHNKHRYFGDDPNAFKEIEEDPVVIDFTGCKYIHDIHMVLKKGLGLPEYYGENWDALWDLVRWFREYPIEIELRGIHALPKEFDEEITVMLQVFNNVSKKEPHIQFIMIP